MSRVDRYLPPARVVDVGILATIVVLLATGVASMFAATPSTAWVYVVHGVGGIVLVGLVAMKLWRVRHRIRARPTGVWTSLALAVLALAALATGIAWVLGLELDLGFWGLLNIHIALGLLVAPVLLLHLRRRFATPSRESLTERRTALQVSGLMIGGAAVWRAQQSLTRLLGAERRFTGSRRAGGEGNDFPITSWVADDPDPIDPEAWSLTVDGRVAEPLELGVEDVGPESEQRALIDCTSGWYAERNWRGVDVGDLLEEAGVKDDAGWVQFRSVTGYKWSLPIEEARDALLATHVGGSRLTHGHGFPLRLVAPGRRGYQWVKWVHRVRISRNRDFSESAAIFISGL